MEKVTRKLFSSDFGPTLTYHFDYIFNFDLFEKISVIE